MRIQSLTLVIVAALILSSGCSREPKWRTKIPFVYKVDIQQGNVVTQDMLARLQPGMDKSQVSFIMGTPLLIDVFHNDRWDYYYSYQKGGKRREQRRVTLIFEDDKLIAVEGDVKVALEPLKPAEPTETTVVVPLERSKTGLFSGLLHTFGLGEEGPPPTQAEHQAMEAELSEHDKELLKQEQIDAEESDPSAPVIPGAEGL